mmetsp:Transcript_10120/g.35732  ORF Transcript_10120/g.35732 Transcript_10120/m.35732 type:complete len:264 (-) Transcript_10120:418-1209(-)
MRMTRKVETFFRRQALAAAHRLAIIFHAPQYFLNRQLRAIKAMRFVSYGATNRGFKPERVSCRSAVFKSLANLNPRPSSTAAVSPTTKANLPSAESFAHLAHAQKTPRALASAAACVDSAMKNACAAAASAASDTKAALRVARKAQSSAACAAPCKLASCCCVGKRGGPPAAPATNAFKASLRAASLNKRHCRQANLALISAVDAKTLATVIAASTARWARAAASDKTGASPTSSTAAPGAGAAAAGAAALNASKASPCEMMT